MTSWNVTKNQFCLTFLTIKQKLMLFQFDSSKIKLKKITYLNVPWSILEFEIFPDVGNRHHSSIAHEFAREIQIPYFVHEGIAYFQRWVDIRQTLGHLEFPYGLGLAHTEIEKEYILVSSLEFNSFFMAKNKMIHKK